MEPFKQPYDKAVGCLFQPSSVCSLSGSITATYNLAFFAETERKANLLANVTAPVVPPDSVAIASAYKSANNCSDCCTHESPHYLDDVSSLQYPLRISIHSDPLKSTDCVYYQSNITAGHFPYFRANQLAFPSSYIATIAPTSATALTAEM